MFTLKVIRGKSVSLEAQVALNYLDWEGIPYKVEMSDADTVKALTKREDLDFVVIDPTNEAIIGLHALVDDVKENGLRKP